MGKRSKTGVLKRLREVKKAEKAEDLDPELMLNPIAVAKIKEEKRSDGTSGYNAANDEKGDSYKKDWR